MKKIIIRILFIIGLFATLSVLLYPVVADYVNTRSQSRVTSNYLEEIAVIDDGNRQAILEAAHEYNRALRNNPDRFFYTDEDVTEYKNQLDLGRGVMGILTIDKINVNLPIYHGTNEGVLQIGAGHLQGTSLPVGGAGTHSFITGHRGLPSSKLLSNLDKLVEGDQFSLYIMGETLIYQVDQIQVVLPDEVNALDIHADMDYCTLVTCTPYGVNTHRLLVRGLRTENDVDKSQLVEKDNNSKQLEKIVVLRIFLIPVIPVLLIITVIRCLKIFKKGRFH